MEILIFFPPEGKQRSLSFVLHLQAQGSLNDINDLVLVQLF